MASGLRPVATAVTTKHQVARPLSHFEATGTEVGPVLGSTIVTDLELGSIARTGHVMADSGSEAAATGWQ